MLSKEIITPDIKNNYKIRKAYLHQKFYCAKDIKIQRKDTLHYIRKKSKW